MVSKIKKKAARAMKRRRRVRGKIIGTSKIPRLTVSKSLNNMYMQIVDDYKNVTLLGLATNSKDFGGKIDKDGSKVDKAKKLGQAVAGLAIEKGIEKVVFDRNQYRYHGRIKAAADGAREKGLKF
ncbi:MAG: 50S ribosomal protein L18 [candidate division Zixibacteria bacterium]